MLSISTILKRSVSEAFYKMSNVNVLLSNVNDVYFNVALEKYLLDSFGKSNREGLSSNLPLLYLWRNAPCLIVGRNQNVWSECNLENVRNDNVKVIRRFTGGGAVYQVCFNYSFTRITLSRIWATVVSPLYPQLLITALK